MTDTKGVFTKETGELKAKVQLRRYDMVDMLTISFYNVLLLGVGLSIGWLIWGYNQGLSFPN